MAETLIWGMGDQGSSLWSFGSNRFELGFPVLVGCSQSAFLCAKESLGRSGQISQTLMPMHSSVMCETLRWALVSADCSKMIEESLSLLLPLSFFLFLFLRKAFRRSSQRGIGFLFFFNLDNFIGAGKSLSTQFYMQAFHFPLRILRSHWILNWRSRLRYVSGHFEIKFKYSDEYLAKDH